MRHSCNLKKSQQKQHTLGINGYLIDHASSSLRNPIALKVMNNLKFGSKCINIGVSPFEKVFLNKV